MRIYLGIGIDAVRSALGQRLRAYFDSAPRNLLNQQQGLAIQVVRWCQFSQRRQTQVDLLVRSAYAQAQARRPSTSGSSLQRWKRFTPYTEPKLSCGSKSQRPM